MRKYILLFLLTCLHIVARGQTPEGVDLSVLPQPTKAEKLQYWFDDDIGSLSYMQQVGGKQTIDVSSLPTGMHIIHYQIVDNKGKVAVPYSAMFMKLAQYNLETASGLQYWFDDDEKSVKKTNLQNGVSTIDVSAINEGLHTLHYQILDNHNKPSYIASAFFMKTGKSLGDETLRAERLMYWFDDEEKIVQADLDAGMNLLDASHLTEGLHTLHYQVLCNNGALTEARSAFFFRVNYDANSAKAKEMRYWYDDQTTARTTEIKEGVQMLDVSDLVAGLHIVHYQLVDESGKLGVPASTMFFKVDAMPELAQAKTQRYWFDDDHEDMHECAVTNGVQSLDVKGLSTGMHTLHYQLVDGAGNVTVPYSGIFMKMSEFESADGKNAIIRYRYWLNDGSDMKTVELQKPSNPFQLISLLPMQKTPIRSSAFHFETKSGEPMIYAKNDFHIRFEDAAGYWSDDARSFVDYSVSEKVTDIAELKSTQTFSRLDNNVIKWFKFDAAPGDTIAFKSSQATSVQVFAPSGNEIFSASGDKSVKYGGTHTWETGTYYVAIHDVTGSQQNITLSYMHMDKYDVVDQDVRVVGNGGCSTITFQGNGFNSLYSVDLKDSKGNIIESIDVGHESDASTTVTFDFTGAKLGKYNAVFHFTEEDKTFAENITVEEAKDIELETKVSCPLTFLRGSSAIYTVEITNKGNTTAYSVPLEMILTANGLDDQIEYVNIYYGKTSLIDDSLIPEADRDSIDEDTYNYIMDMYMKSAMCSSFVIETDSLGRKTIGYSTHLLTISPNSTVVLHLEVKSSTQINLQAIIPGVWNSFSFNKSLVKGQKMRANSFASRACCEKEKWECLVSSTCDVIGLIPVAGCITGIADLAFYEQFEIACSDGNWPYEKQFNFIKNAVLNKNNAGKSLLNKTINAGIGCLLGSIGKKLSGLKSDLKYSNVVKDNLRKAYQDATQKAKDAWKEYDTMMYKAEDLYNTGKIAEAEAKAVEAKVLKAKAEAADIEATVNKELYEQQKLRSYLIENEIDGYDLKLKDLMGNIYSWGKTIGKAIFNDILCKEQIREAKKCLPDPKDDNKSSTPVNSLDPNDIYGYIAPSGSKFIGEEVINLPYRIEFENDTTFATASAHTVIVKDTLDASKFDLASYKPTSIKIGDKDVQLNGDKTFVTTVDMRPAINAIAQVEGLYDAQKGIATWKFTSLDPMTMEETDDVMQGFLPVNFDGSGIGEVAFNIDRLANLADGTEINNKASIVFDSNDAIETPVWTNIIDRISPNSRIGDIEQLNDSIVRVHINGYDRRSGIWKYAAYVQYGENTSWNQICETDTTCFDFRFYEDIDYGFCVLATDSAGNVEQKIIQREYKFRNGKGEMIDGIILPRENQVTINKAYDLSGRLIQEEGYRGIIIKNRKKSLRR